MSLVALSLVLIAALFHATWNLQAKLATGAPGFMLLTAWGLVVIWAPVMAVSLATSTQVSPFEWNLHQWCFVLLSSGVHALYFYLLLEGYRAAPLSVVYPTARGVGPLVSSSAAVFFLGEALSWGGWAGVFSIALGVYLLAQSSTGSSEDRRSVFVGVLYGIATGATIGLYTVIDGYSVKHLEMNPLYFEYTGGVVRAVVLLPMLSKGIPILRTSLRNHGRAIFAVSFLGPAAYIAVLYAMQLSQISQVAPARELSLLFGAYLGGSLLKEGSLLKRLLAAGGIAVGVVLLTRG